MRFAEIIDKWFPVPSKVKEDGLGLTIPQARMVRERAIRAFGEAMNSDMATAVNTARQLAQERKLHAEIETGLQSQIESLRRELDTERDRLKDAAEQIDRLEHRLTDVGHGGMM